MGDITAIILTKNESMNIVECLESIKGFAKRTVVVDSGSTDDTVELAKKHGADVYYHPFEYYAKQFNWALDNTAIKTKWVLRLDADERFTPELCKECEVLMERHAEDEVNGITMEAWLYFLGRRLERGVSLISAIGFWTVGAISKGNSVVLLASLLAGSVLGFLFYNFNPARIFMGDAGSTFLGLCLAIIALLIPKYSVDKSSLYAPILILALPIFETGVSILRRSFMKQNILTADKQHLHHKLLDMGFNQKMAVGIIYALSIFSVVLGVVVYNTKQHKLGIVFIVIFILYGLVVSIKGVYFEPTVQQMATAKVKKNRKL